MCVWVSSPRLWCQASFFVCAYFTELSDASMRGLPNVLSIHGILSEEQVDFIILWVVTLWDLMNPYKPGVCSTEANACTHK